MTTFKDFISESNELELINMASNTVVKSCKPYIYDGGGTEFFFFRGMAKQPEQFVYKNVRKDRIPLSIPSVIHEFIDQWFNNNFGFPYRSQGLFVTGNKATAEEYANMANGSAFTVFPVGQFSYVWSSEVEDLFAVLNELDEKIHMMSDEDRPKEALGIYGGPHPKKLNDFQKEQITQVLKNAQYIKNSGLDKAANRPNEVMIACDSYYALNANINLDTLGRTIEEKM